jgi:hypothetical protein
MYFVAFEHACLIMRTAIILAVPFARLQSHPDAASSNPFVIIHTKYARRRLNGSTAHG